MGADGWLRYPRMDHCYKSIGQDWEKHLDKGNIFDPLGKFITQVFWIKKFIEVKYYWFHKQPSVWFDGNI